MSNIIHGDKSYKVSGEMLMRLKDLIGALFRDIGYWRSNLSSAFDCVSDDPMSAAKFIARITKIALQIERDTAENRNALKNMASEMAAEPIGDAKE